MQTVFRVAALAACLALAAPAAAQIADPVPGPIPTGTLVAAVEEIVQLPDSGTAGKPRARPMLLTGDDSGRSFVVDQNGVIYQLHPNGSVSTFLDVEAATDLVANQGQKGVSSFAFHPDYFEVGSPGEGKFFTASSQTATSGTPDFPVPMGAPESHHSVLHEWAVMAGDPDAIDPTSVREILRVGEAYGDHNIAQISFDPGAVLGSANYGALYVGMGDGGNVGPPRPSVDPFFQGQDLSAPLGTLLRIDPLAPAGGGAYAIPTDNPFANDGDPNTLAEIWAYGLRNPHRFSWDLGGSGQLFVSDIGQANVEEIDWVRVGENHGWSEREGTFAVVHTNATEVFALPAGDAALGYTYPVLQYDHDEGDRAVSGGYVYRGSAIPSLRGRYVFGDLVSGRIFYANVEDLDGSGPASFFELRLIDAADGQAKSLLEMIGGGTPAPRADLRFGIDDDGELYLLTKQDGRVRRLRSAAALVPAISGFGTAVLVVGLIAAARRMRAARRVVGSLEG